MNNQTIMAHWRQLTPSPLNREVRGATIDPAEIAELADSLLEQGGVVQPLNVIPLPSGSPLLEEGEGLGVRYQILTGERRWLAAKSLEDRAPLLTCVVVADPGSEVDQLITMGVENLQRANLTAIAEARYYRALQNRGLNEKQIARRTGRRLSRIKQCLALLDLPEPIQDHIDAGRLPASIQKTLSPLPPDLQIEIADKTIGRSKTEIERVVNLVQANRQRTQLKHQLNGGKHHNRETPEPPAIIQHDHLMLAIRATCAACESYHLMKHDLAWEDMAAGLNQTCDACEVKGIKEACSLCPLVDFLKLLQQLQGDQGQIIGPPHLYKIGVLQ